MNNLQMQVKELGAFHFKTSKNVNESEVRSGKAQFGNPQMRYGENQASKCCCRCKRFHFLCLQHRLVEKKKLILVQ